MDHEGGEERDQADGPQNGRQLQMLHRPGGDVRGRVGIAEAVSAGRRDGAHRVSLRHDAQPRRHALGGQAAPLAGLSPSAAGTLRCDVHQSPRRTQRPRPPTMERGPTLDARLDVAEAPLTRHHSSHSVSTQCSPTTFAVDQFSEPQTVAVSGCLLRAPCGSDDQPPWAAGAGPRSADARRS